MYSQVECKGLRVKSSSRLFPVRLSSAESYGDLLVDVYTIKPNNSPDKSVELAVTRVGHCQRELNSAGASPIILFHGCYQNRRLWLGDAGGEDLGCAAYLSALGYDVWLMEARGHGLARQNDSFEHNTLVDYASYDLPAVNAFVAEITNNPPLWLAYGEGYGALLLALGGGAIASAAVAGVIGAGTPFPCGSIRRLPLAQHVAEMMRYGDSSNSSVGPELEPRQLRNQLWREQGVFSHRGKAMGLDLWRSLPALHCPIGLMAAESALELLEPGLREAIDKNGIQRLETGLQATDLAAEQISATLCENDKVKQFCQPVINWLNLLGAKHEILSSGASSPAC